MDRATLRTGALVPGAAIAVTLLCGHVRAQSTPRSLSDWDQLLDRLWEEQKQLAPRGGRWVITCRERGQPSDRELVVWDSGDPATQKRPVEVPCWLPLVIIYRIDGLVDGRQQLYNGPLIARTSGDCEILGPYPEGFVYVADGRVTATIVPHFEPFRDTVIGLSIYSRPPMVQVPVDGGLWPPSLDFYIGWPLDEHEQGVWGQFVRFATIDMEGGFRMSPVRSEVLAGQRTIFAEAFFAMAGGRPARQLPVQFEWEVTGLGDHPDVVSRIVHEGTTNHEGRAADTLQVPVGVERGSVRFWSHQVGTEFTPASGQKFDFTEAGQ